LVTPWSLRRQGFEVSLSKLLTPQDYPPVSNLCLTSSEAAAWRKVSGDTFLLQYARRIPNNLRSAAAIAAYARHRRQLQRPNLVGSGENCNLWRTVISQFLLWIERVATYAIQ